MSEIRRSWMTILVASVLIAGVLAAGCSESDSVPTFEAAEAPELIDFGQQPFTGTPDAWPGVSMPWGSRTTETASKSHVMSTLWTNR